MALKFYNLPAADEDQRSSATNLSQTSATHRHADFDARDGEHCCNDIDVGSGSVGQQKTAKIPPRLRILSAAAKLFLRHGIAGVSVEAIAKAAGSAKPTLYNHFVSKDELVAEYLRESAERLAVCWAGIGPLGSASALVQLGSWLSEMADGLANGWASRLAMAAAELKEKSHPAQRVINTYNALQRRRLTRLCRATACDVRPQKTSHETRFVLCCFPAKLLAKRDFFLVGAPGLEPGTR